MNGSFVKLGDDLIIDVRKVTAVVNNGGDECFIYFDGYSEFDDRLRVSAKFADVADIIGAKSEYLLGHGKCC